MSRITSKLSANQYWHKNRTYYILLVLVLSTISIKSSEPVHKKIKQEKLDSYGVSNIPLGKTHLGKWLAQNRDLLQRKGIYLSDRKETKSRTKFDSPEKLSIAGMLFLIYRMPLEIQQQIIAYLADGLSPLTSGVQEQDLAMCKIYRHINPPFIRHLPADNSTVECSSDHCKPQPIALEHGYFKNNTVEKCPTLIDYLWQLMQAKTKKESLTGAKMIAVNRKEQTIFTGHEFDESISRAPTYYWQITNLSKNKRLLSNPITHDFDLSDIFGLLDAENILQDKTPMQNIHKKKKLPLTKTSITAFALLKRKFATLETENKIPVEPLFVDEQLIDESDQRRRILKRGNAFIGTYPKLSQQN